MAGILLPVGKALGLTFVAASSINALIYRVSLRKELNPVEDAFENVDGEVLAKFPVDRPVPSEGSTEGFFFGLATAPAHVEDKLDDAWLEFAKETVPSRTVDSENNERPAKETFAEKESLASKAPFTKAAENDKKGAENGEKSSVNDENITRNTQKTPESYENVSGKPESGKIATGHDAPMDKFEDSKRTEAEKASEGTKEGVVEEGERGVTSDGEDMNVAAFHNVPRPDERTRFWSDPDTELKLAADTGCKVFRLGVDWGRMVPVEPKEGTRNVIERRAVGHYRWILKRVRAHGMKVMLTLFHHSCPKWALDFDGWANRKMVNYFLEWTEICVESYADLVDYWIPFNEPHIYVGLAHCSGDWPGGHKPSLKDTLLLLTPFGAFGRAMNNMADAHIGAYDIIHRDDNIGWAHIAKGKPQVGVAHHVSFMRPKGLYDVPAVFASNTMTRFRWVDKVRHKLDFIGVNFYGQEIVSAPGLKLMPDEEYSDSGRGVLPNALYNMLLAFYERYKDTGLRYIITENGVSDSTDIIRRPYMVEHLLAINAAMQKGVPVDGYLFWTCSDNWEWADGYGPKFGLVEVDRKNNLKRTPRPSYYLFSEIAKKGVVTKTQREEAWHQLQKAAQEGCTRSFCREVDNWGLMYAGGLDTPSQREIIARDWRFGKYEYKGLQDPVSRFVRFIFGGFLKRNRKAKEQIQKALPQFDANPALLKRELPVEAVTPQEQGAPETA